MADPTVDNTVVMPATEPVEASEVADEVLVEEVSIDGMCGVY